MRPARIARWSALLLAAAVPAAAGPAVTVYSRDLGFVRETRTVTLRAARDTIRLADLGERMDFSSLRLEPGAGARLARLATRGGSEAGEGLLARARGSRVRLAARDDRVIEGVLEALDGNWLVVRGDDGLTRTVARAAVEEVRFANPLTDEPLRPVVEAVLEGRAGARADLGLAYLTGGLSWSAEHTLVRTGERAGTWAAAVTVENASGRAFADATLRLVAGEPRRTGASPPAPLARGALMAMAEEKADLGGEVFSEYHLYTLDRPATLRDGETQALTMLTPRAVRFTPRYLVRGGAPGVAVQLVFENREAAGLGVPLPAGRVRVYEPDAGGAEQWAGETLLRHTAAGEEFTLEVGTAFDLAAERRLVAQRRIGDREQESTVELQLRNRKRGPVTIVVEEPVAGDHEVIRSSHPPARKDANTLRFELPVAPGQETVLTYTVRIRY